MVTDAEVEAYLTVFWNGKHETERDAVRAALEAAAAVRPVSEIERLRASHARLLAALKALLHPDNALIVWFVPCDADATELREQARAAIAEAEGGGE